MADLTTSDAGFWRKGRDGGMVPYNHDQATDQVWGSTSTPTTGGGLTPQGGTSGGGAPSSPSPQPLQPSPAPQIPQGGGAITSALPRTQGDPLTAAGGQSPAPQNPQQQMQGMLRTQIMSLLGQNVNSASVQDADLAPQSQAFANAANRAAAARRAEVVHQAQRGGYGNSGGLEQRLDALSERTGQAIGANDAALIGQKLETRRQQLNTALGLAQQAGLADEANNLQRELANLGAQIETRGQDISMRGQDVQSALGSLDANTRLSLGNLNAQMQREGYSTQERLARLDAELRRYGIDVQGRLGELDAALRSQLGNRQIDLGYDQLGVDVGEIQARLNREALLAGMGA